MKVIAGLTISEVNAQMIGFVCSDSSENCLIREKVLAKAGQITCFRVYPVPEQCTGIFNLSDA